MVQPMAKSSYSNVVGSPPKYGALYRSDANNKGKQSTTPDYRYSISQWKDITIYEAGVSSNHQPDEEHMYNT
ncbi:type II secretion system protein D [Acrasis kona]|uniref:Type II secretion system protein D n=1 Tax=Acrasis kona TaxID=1008807 RepID=A0AAW2Z0T1_9EUKA